MELEWEKGRLTRERVWREGSLERERRGREMWNFGDIGRSQMESEMGAPPHNTAARRPSSAQVSLTMLSFQVGMTIVTLLKVKTRPFFFF